MLASYHITSKAYFLKNSKKFLIKPFLSKTAERTKRSVFGCPECSGLTKNGHATNEEAPNGRQSKNYWTIFIYSKGVGRSKGILTQARVKLAPPLAECDPYCLALHVLLSLTWRLHSRGLTKRGKAKRQSKISD